MRLLETEFDIQSKYSDNIKFRKLKNYIYFGYGQYANDRGGSKTNPGGSNEPPDLVLKYIYIYI